MTDSAIKTLKLPTFDCKQPNFQMWCIKMQAYAGVYGFSSALKPIKDSDLPSADSAPIDETTEEGKRQALAKRRNILAVANLTMEITTEAGIALVYKGMTEE